MEGRNDSNAVSSAGLRVLTELVEASKLYRVRHVKTGHYLRVSYYVGESENQRGRVHLSWDNHSPHFPAGSWDKQAALGLAKFWIALTGDMDVEIEEVKA